MSEQDLLAVTERAIAAFNAGDAEKLSEIADSEVEFFSYLGQIDGREYRGHNGVREWFMRVREAFPTAHVELIDQKQEGSSVFSHLRMKATGGGSGQMAEREIWLCTTFLDGRVKRFTWHTRPEDAQSELARRGETAEHPTQPEVAG